MLLSDRKIYSFYVTYAHSYLIISQQAVVLIQGIFDTLQLFDVLAPKHSDVQASGLTASELQGSAHWRQSGGFDFEVSFFGHIMSLAEFGVCQSLRVVSGYLWRHDPPISES